MSSTRTYSTTAGVTKAYGATRGAVRSLVCFTSAGRDRESALLHVVHPGRLPRGQRTQERALAGGGAAERGLKLGVGDVHVWAPGDVGGLGRVLLRQGPEVRLVGEVRRRRGQRGLRGGVRRVDAAVGHQRGGRRRVGVQPGGELGGGLLVLGRGPHRGGRTAPVADDVPAGGPLRQLRHLPLARAGRGRGREVAGCPDVGDPGDVL